MLRKQQWNWDNAVEGMRVEVVNLHSSEINNGIVCDVKRSDKCRFIDGKPVKSSQVVSMTISCDDGLEIIAMKDNIQYQITLK